MLLLAPEPEFPEAAVAEFAASAERTADDIRELMRLQHEKILELKNELGEYTKLCARLETENRELRTRFEALDNSRDSLEILLGMANGEIAFDHNKFRAAATVLPHQYAKKSETRTVTDNRSINYNISHEDNMRTMNETLQRALAEHNMKVVK